MALFGSWGISQRVCHLYFFQSRFQPHCYGHAILGYPRCSPTQFYPLYSSLGDLSPDYRQLRPMFNRLSTSHYSSLVQCSPAHSQLQPRLSQSSSCFCIPFAECSPAYDCLHSLELCDPSDPYCSEPQDPNQPPNGVDTLRWRRRQLPVGTGQLVTAVGVKTRNFCLLQTSEGATTITTPWYPGGSTILFYDLSISQPTVYMQGTNSSLVRWLSETSDPANCCPSISERYQHGALTDHAFEWNWINGFFDSIIDPTASDLATLVFSLESSGQEMAWAIYIMTNMLGNQARIQPADDFDKAYGKIKKSLAWLQSIWLGFDALNRDDLSGLITETFWQVWDVLRIMDSLAQQECFNAEKFVLSDKFTAYMKSMQQDLNAPLAKTPDQVTLYNGAATKLATFSSFDPMSGKWTWNSDITAGETHQPPPPPPDQADVNSLEQHHSRISQQCHHVLPANDRHQYCERVDFYNILHVSANLFAHRPLRHELRTPNVRRLDPRCFCVFWQHYISTIAFFRLFIGLRLQWVRMPLGWVYGVYRGGLGVACLRNLSMCYCVSY
ncbi:hypothetical protein HD806DRAFT_544130 [Xylariaceae sp. AK1471]|nr:hypothetical protein HD806DRAFT_544130 [Xylariaceae sp. AK1471]